jgi:hypothetical protein
MKANIRSIALILPMLLSSCVHKTNQALNLPPLAPPIEDAPLPKPDSAPANLPPPVISVPDKGDTQPAAATPKEETPAPAPKHKRKNNSAPAQAPAPGAQTTEVASTAGGGVPAGGNFSSGDTADLKDQTQSMITDTERALKGINRKLNDLETKTSAQVKEFLKEARTALNSNDVDGAHTLAVKAKVLLSEISQ